MKSARAMVVSLNVALMACASTPSHVVASAPSAGACPGSTRVPFVNMDGKRPAINVTVNGTGPHLFLFDTGAEGYARADTSLVSALHLPDAGLYVNSDKSTSAAQSIKQVKFAQLGLGTLSFRDVIAPSRDYNGTAKRVPIAGILGLGLFKNCLVTLDYAKGELLIAPGQLVKGLGAVSYTGDGAPRAPIRVAGKLTEGEIDTGDAESFTLPAALAASLPIDGTPKVVGTGKSANTVFEIREAPLRGSINIAGANWQNPSVVFADPFDFINVGSGALQGRALTIDQRNRLLSISDPRGGSIPSRRPKIR